MGKIDTVQHGFGLPNSLRLGICRINSDGEGVREGVLSMVNWP